MINCSKAKDLLSAFVDKELSSELSESINAHVKQCADCESEIAQFKQVGLLAADLDEPPTPESVWIAVSKELENESRGTVQLKSNINRRMFQVIVAIAATLLVGYFAFPLFNIGTESEEMAKAMEQVATDLNSENATTLLINRYGGSEVSYPYDDAITHVGYHPIAKAGLPNGYSIECMQVLDMPCCKCTQTACLRPDNSRFFVYEHDDAETGWFTHRNSHESESCGLVCHVVKLDNKLAVTWKKDDRYITVLGIHDQQELDLLVSNF